MPAFCGSSPVLISTNSRSLLPARAISAATASAINKPVPGGSEIQYYNWYDYYLYAQDEWRIRPNFTLTYGLRYETPGNSIGSLQPFNDAILAVPGVANVAIWGERIRLQAVEVVPEK